MSPEEIAVREAHALFIDAVNAADLARVLGLMTQDAVFIHPGRAPFGRDAFPAGFTAGHRDYELHCTSELEEVVVAGRVAYTRARDTLTLAPRAGGATTQLAGYRLSIYRFEADGAWRLARDAHTVGT